METLCIGAVTARTGKLVVVGEPHGQRVNVVCGSLRESLELPGRLTVPQGDCTVSAERSGYQPFEAKVMVPDGEEVTVKVHLQRLAAPEPAPPEPKKLSETASVAAGTWRDTTTGLTWQVTPTGVTMDPRAAQRHCRSLSLAGGGWRLPTISELRSLIRGCPVTELGGSCSVTDDCVDWERCRGDSCDGCSGGDGPANGSYWPVEMLGSNDFHWSSSQFHGYYWAVRFSYGILYSNITSDAVVRCVR